MRPAGLNRDFILIGENIHTTRVLLRNGRRVAPSPDGVESVLFENSAGETGYLPIPEELKRRQDYEEGRVKHVMIAVLGGMRGDPLSLDYLRVMAARQIARGAGYLDLNVDEISHRLPEQIAAIQWLVRTIEEFSSVPLAIDSSNVDIILAGLDACQGRAGRPLLNSASLERSDALDAAARRGIPVMVTAAGASGMPSNAADRVNNASQMIDAALARGLDAASIFVDPLMFPISVDSEFGNHCLDAIRELRARYGPAIHISGGLSNVSFGLPARKLINEVFIRLAVEAGADSGIVDPVANDLHAVFQADRSARPQQLAEEMLLGRDRGCKNFLRAYRKGELSATL
ncbi:MAG: hypothetical protein FJW40_07570 [Acidobacteria bacterium]|nr:hypothetical protein [Acidobacteriota bacterium]